MASERRGGQTFSSARFRLHGRNGNPPCFSIPQASRAIGSRNSGGLSCWAQVPQTRRGARSIAWNGGGVCSLRSVKMFPAPMGAGMPLACTVSLGGRRRHWPLSLRPASSARGSRGVAMTLTTGRGVGWGGVGWGGGGDYGHASPTRLGRMRAQGAGFFNGSAARSPCSSTPPQSNARVQTEGRGRLQSSTESTTHASSVASHGDDKTTSSPVYRGLATSPACQLRHAMVNGLSDWERRFEETSAYYHIGEEPSRESRDSWSTPPVRPRLERY